MKDTEDALMTNMRDSHILNHKENLDWNWCLIGTILKVKLWLWFTEDDLCFQQILMHVKSEQRSVSCHTST